MASKQFIIEENNPLIGYKGFKQLPDGSVKCRNQVYKVGETYVLSEEPIICSRGFHFCRELEQVFEFYSDSEPQHVYYTVAGWGNAEEEHNKIATDHIKLLKRISENDMIIHKLRPHMKQVDAILEDNPNAIISGSLALILLGVLPYREIHDMDINIPYFAGAFKDAQIANRFGESGAETVQMVLSKPGINVSFDVFINPSTLYIDVIFDGKKYKVCDFKPIMEAKFKYMMKGNEKHADDIIEFINIMKKKASARQKSNGSKTMAEAKSFGDILNNIQRFSMKNWMLDEHSNDCVVSPVAKPMVKSENFDDDFPF